jgi:pilus assembly protein CpaB
MNKRFLLALAGAVFFGLLAIIAARYYLQQQASDQRSQEEADVMIATADIPIGTIITAQQVATARYDRKYLPEGVLTKREEVIGRVTVTDISNKMPIISRQLAAPDSPAGLPGVLPVGMRAVSVRVDEASSVAGFALAGNYVDVIVIIQPQANDARPVSKVILQNIKVLATGQQMQARNDGKATLANTVTLLVTPAQAERLKLAESEGKLQLSIRNSTDQIAEKTLGATKRDLIDPQLEARALQGVRRADAPARPATAAPIPPLRQVDIKDKEKSPPGPPRLVIPIELIEGSKRSRIELLP